MTYEEWENSMFLFIVGSVAKFCDGEEAGIIKLKDGVEYLPADKDFPRGSTPKDVN